MSLVADWFLVRSRLCHPFVFRYKFWYTCVIQNGPVMCDEVSELAIECCSTFWMEIAPHVPSYWFPHSMRFRLFSSRTVESITKNISVWTLRLFIALAEKIDSPALSPSTQRPALFIDTSMSSHDLNFELLLWILMNIHVNLLWNLWWKKVLCANYSHLPNFFSYK